MVPIKLQGKSQTFGKLGILSQLYFLLQLCITIESNKKPDSPFRWSKSKNCYVHPAEPHMSDAKCLKLSKIKLVDDDSSDYVKNCDFHHDGICLECSPGFFLDFSTFSDGNLRCSACVKGCRHCKGPTLKECYEVDEGFRFDNSRRVIEGCGANFQGKNRYSILFLVCQMLHMLETSSIMGAAHLATVNLGFVKNARGDIQLKSPRKIIQIIK